MGSTIWQVITLILVAAVILEAIALAAVMRQLGTLLLRIGPSLPGDVEGGPEMGSKVAFEELPAGRAAIFLFLASDCDLCHKLMPSVAVIERDYPSLEVVAIPRWAGGEVERNAYVARLGSIAHAELHELYELWSVPGSPYGVALDREGRIRMAGVVNTLEHLDGLASAAMLEPVPDEGEAHSNGRRHIHGKKLLQLAGARSKGGDDFDELESY